MTQDVSLSHNFAMAAFGTKTIPSRKRWLFSLLTACLLAFQTSNIIHDLDIAAHADESDCEICDLFVSANDDVDAISVVTTTVDFTNATFASVSREVFVGNKLAYSYHIRAPPYLT